MSLRPPAVRRLALFGLAGVFASVTPAGAALDKAIRESTEPAQHSKLINDYVASLVSKLTGPDVDAARKAREDLVSDVIFRPGAPVEPSVQFKEYYSAVVNSSLTPLMSSPDVHKRLAGAIVAARIATETGSPALRNVLTAALEDKSQAVCLWGIKGAADVLPQVVGNGVANATERLTPGLLSAADRFGDMPVIVLESYDAAEMGVTAANSQAAVPPVVKKAVATTQQLMRLRLRRAVAKDPLEPTLDSAPVGMLTRGAVLAAAAPAERVATVELVFHMLHVAGQRAAARPAPDASLYAFIRTAAGGLQVAAGPGNTGLEGVLQPLVKLTPNRPPGQLLGLVEAVLPELRKIAQFKDVSKAPTIVETAPPPPAVAPATVPAAAPEAPAE